MLVEKVLIDSCHELQLNFDAEILDLAKRAGMNTEVRRNVFCSVGQLMKSCNNEL